MQAISEVFNIDCLEYMATIPDKFFDLAIADPPYGKAGDECGRTGGTWATKYGTNIKQWDLAPSRHFFDELRRVSKNQIIWGANYFTMPPTRNFIVWRKMTISESFTMAMAEYAWTSFSGNAKVIELPPQGKQSDPRFHPTQKPVELYAWVLNHYANPGDKIFDPMMGSQSSRIAAGKLGFDYYGCEIDNTYFDKGNERFARECNGIIVANGLTVTQQSLF